MTFPFKFFWETCLGIGGDTQINGCYNRHNLYSSYDGHPKLVQFLSEKQNYKCFSLFTGVS